MEPGALLKRAYDPEDFRREAHALVDRLADYLSDVRAYPANPYASPEDSLDVFRTLLARRAAPAEIFDRVIEDSVHLHHPDYMGHQVVPPAPLAATGDLAASLLNTGMAIFEMGRPGTAIEVVVIEEMARLLELSPTAGGFLTSGGSLANLTALLAARARFGTVAAPCVLVSDQAHYCIQRAVHVMGWGEEGIVQLPTDAELRVDVSQLDGIVEATRAAGRNPVAIVGCACTTNTGTYDPLDELAAAAARHGLWLHVDGAHGAGVRLDPDRKHLVRGLERADSIALDFHKMFLTPAITTALFFRDGQDAYRTFRQRAEYLLAEGPDAEWFNIARRSFECTKRMLGLRMYLLLSAYGPDLFREYIARVGWLGRKLAELVRRNPDLELLLEPDINIVCFRFIHLTLNPLACDATNEIIRSRLVETGQPYIVQTRIKNRTYLRCTLTNAFTGESDLYKMLLQVTSIGHDLVALRQNIG